jgi:hypothetical protein
VHKHVYPIARIDIPFNQNHPSSTFAVVKVLRSQAEAEAEVSRLNQVNADKSCVYLYCTSRLIESDDSGVPENPDPLVDN